MFDNDFISDCQHGFIPGRSCTTQLLEVLDKWTDILDSGGALETSFRDVWRKLLTQFRTGIYF